MFEWVVCTCGEDLGEKKEVDQCEYVVCPSCNRVWYDIDKSMIYKEYDQQDIFNDIDKNMVYKEYDQ